MTARRRIVVLGTLLAVAATTTAAGGASGPAQGRLVIGKPSATPALSSKRFTASFRVKRSDTGKALLAARIAATATIGGRHVRVGATFRNGTARVSLLVPATAIGERLTVKLSVRSDGRSAQRTATYPILRGQPRPFVSIGDAAAPEGQTGTTPMTFTVQLSAPDVQWVSVDYKTVDGTATEPSDYTAASGNLTFAPGTTSQTVTVQATADTTIEPDEAFKVVLSNAFTAVIGDGTATGTITNDDFLPRAGHYQGTSSQGRQISFELSDDLTRIKSLQIFADLQCEGTTRLDNYGISLSNLVIPVGKDWTFTFSSHTGTAMSYLRVDGTGHMDPPYKAGGTFVIDRFINIPSPYGRCMGHAGWNAEGPSARR